LIPVTSTFKSAIYSPSRQTIAKVAFQIVDVTADGDASISVSDESFVSLKDQVSNTNTEMNGKYITFEDDYIKLDGSFVLMPKPTESGYEVGWWSDDLCDTNGEFTVPQVITVDFTQDHSSIGLTISFDRLANEYAEDFTIDVYDSTNALIHTETVVGNTNALYILEQNLANYRKIVVSITKLAGYDSPDRDITWGNDLLTLGELNTEWQLGRKFWSRRARVTEISFGIIEEYTGEELINVNILEQIDAINESVPSNEMSFTIRNDNKRFNILNPQGIYPFLQRRQKLIPYLGVLKPLNITEFVKMGIYYLTEWKSDEGSLTATFTSRDILDIITQGEFAGATYTSKTLEYIAEDILDSAGVSDYEIDAALQGITVSSTLPVRNHRELLQMVAIAGQAVLYSDRDGKIIIKRLSNTVSGETIDFDNTYNSPQIKLDKLVNTIIVVVGSSEYVYVDPLKPASEQTLAVKIDNPLIKTNGHALNVAIWILNAYKKRFLYEINFRGNPALESGDIVTVQDDFSENRQVRITRNEFNFDGALRCKVNGKGSGT